MGTAGKQKRLLVRGDEPVRLPEGFLRADVQERRVGDTDLYPGSAFQEMRKHLVFKTEGAPVWELRDEFERQARETTSETIPGSLQR